MASLTSRILFGMGVVLGGAAIASPVLAQSPPIEQQLNMRLHEFERARERQKAERLLVVADRELAWGRVDGAIAAWQQAADIYSSVGDLTQLQNVIELLTKQLVLTRRYDDAETVILQQLTLARDQRDRVNQVYALNNLGVVYLQSGRLAAGEAAIADALDLAEDLFDNTSIGLSLSNLGLAARLANDLPSARDYYESAVYYRQAAGDRVGMANSSNSLGAVYRQLNNDDRALNVYLDARAAALAANHLPTLLTALDGIVGIYADRGDVEALQTYVEERTALTPQLAPPEQQLGLYVGLGQYYGLLEDYPRAKIAYDEALAIAEEIGAAAKRTFILNQLQGLALLVDDE